MKPLAEQLRADKIEDVIGQKHLVSDGKILSNLVKQKKCVNMIFHGPSGVGKTTVANILAKNMNKTFYKLNATNASIKDVHEIANKLNTIEGVNGILLYLDEIQNFNKKQQQALLEYVERGDITLIASTTENPYFYIYPALLSRCLVFEFKKIETEDIKEFLEVKLKELGFEADDMALNNISVSSGGDVRRALNIVDAVMINKDNNEEMVIKNEDVEAILQNKYVDYDRNGNSHYDYLSAFQKSIRGSDPDAALHYLGRLILADDMISICRRLLVISTEDIGLAYPNAISIVKSCTDAAREVGFPEARIPLAEATILLCILPKSNSVETAIDAALMDIQLMDIGEIPIHIRDKHTNSSKAKYKYPHDYPNHYVDQEYMPKEIRNRKYYNASTNKFENSMEKYWNEIKNNK